MKYPKFITKKSVIGITAPSAGVGEHITSFNKSLTTLRSQGFQLIETESVRQRGITSTNGKQRAEELDQVITNKEVDFVFCASGGDFLMEMLPFINWYHIIENPKWMMGYSDPTTLLYIITTKLDIATLYGQNAGSFDQINLHPSLQNSLEIMTGNLVEQTSFDYYQKEWKDELDGYNLTEKVEWETPNGPVDITGRIIGGCIECLKDLLGTRYDATKDFVEKYKEDGIIWYFDIAEQSAEDFYRTLFQMKEAGWFSYIKGVLVGRPFTPKSYWPEFTYQLALQRIWEELPIIYNADIGHLPPKMTIINGALCHITCKDGKGAIKFSI